MQGDNVQQSFPTPTPSNLKLLHKRPSAAARAHPNKLFRTWSSPFALRIVWALKLKDIPYETIFEDLANKSHLLVQYNPVHQKVPVLVHDGKPVAESFVILEYIEESQETWKQNPLLSQDPHDRATARFWAKSGDEKMKLLVSIWEAFNSEGKEQEEGIVRAKENLKYLEEELKGKKFFGVERIGFVDIALGWLALYENVFEEVTSMSLITEDEFPLLSEWKRSFANAPFIKETWPPKDKLVTKFQRLREANLLKNQSK